MSERRPAQVGVEHDPGRVEDGTERPLGAQGEPLAHLVGPVVGRAGSAATGGIDRLADRRDHGVTGRPSKEGRDRRLPQQVVDRGEGAPRVGHGRRR